MVCMDFIPFWPERNKGLISIDSGRQRVNTNCEDVVGANTL